MGLYDTLVFDADVPWDLRMPCGHVARAFQTKALGRGLQGYRIHADGTLVRVTAGFVDPRDGTQSLAELEALPTEPFDGRIGDRQVDALTFEAHTPCDECLWGPGYDKVERHGGHRVPWIDLEIVWQQGKIIRATATGRWTGGGRP